MQYTHTEKTVKKYLPAFALEQAKGLLNGKSVCINAMTKYKVDELLTLVQINELVETLVDDTNFHG
jgi:hypothetical protein